MEILQIMFLTLKPIYTIILSLGILSSPLQILHYHSMPPPQDLLTISGIIIFPTDFSYPFEKFNDLPYVVYLVPTKSYDFSRSLEENLQSLVSEDPNLIIYEVFFDQLALGIPDLKSKFSQIKKVKFQRDNQRAPFDAYEAFYGSLHWDTHLEQKYKEQLDGIFDDSLKYDGRIELELIGNDYNLRYESFEKSRYLFGFSEILNNQESISHFIDLDFTFKH